MKQLARHWRDELTIAAVLATLAVLVATGGWAWRLDRLVYDLGLSLWTRPPPPGIVIVAIDAASIAAKLGLPPAEVSCIKTAALLHDIGSLSVPNMILMKAPYLSTREMSIYKRHCQAGASMLENIQGFSHIIPIIHAHHEKWDGTGYPKRLKGVNIPLGARIISVADHYDKFINPCTQQWQKTHSEAIIELQNKAGLDFDPNVVKAFMQSVIPSKIIKQKK